MTDISPDTAENEEEDYEPTPSLYVEKHSRMLYEVHFFDTFAVVRPACPMLYRELKRLDLIEFSKLFDEFYGDHEWVHNFLRNGGELEIEVTE